MREPVVIVRNLWKYYNYMGQRIAILKGINMLLYRGDIAGIHGPSGAGKTTLLKILAGLERPDSGEVVIEGYNLTMLGDDGLAELRTGVVSFIPQDYGLIDDFTVYENVELPLLVAGAPEEERKVIISDILRYMGIADKIRTKVKFLSGGEKQRVAIARALVITPSLLLADEPTANLDWENAKKVLELFIRINKDFQTTIIIVSHDARVLEYTNRRFVLLDGMLKEV
ncbi:ABC transporter ATP-binding protein [Ignisphaera sp. 4213-co]|uniref:ABC transporter ATP-binding protein n=1 Tax=Ignisphaera cupida TaxID=3050454 RepID=A0ABD4Z6X6_9CREN|nr:ABC transporter ATP-binding protein [Ignisphaera sp. 4213-co]MDK6029081.1 ABC transporter ATP-binding protein [Ignisphaera sp. 4213-co]